MLETFSQPISIAIRPKARGAVAAGHPWVMADSIVAPAQISVGAYVQLTLPDGKPIAAGLYNPNSRIAVRTYSTKPNEPIDHKLFVARIQDAIQLRKRLTMIQSEADGQADSRGADSMMQSVRLVFSEADRLSGLVIDKFGNYIVVQQLAACVEQFIPFIIEFLANRFQPDGIVWMVDESTSKLEGINTRYDWVHGTKPTESIEINESGIRIQIDLGSSQKTGYYLDQRDNRIAASKWIAPDARVLDVCCYVGGFSLRIAKDSPNRDVLGIDTSALAVQQSTANASLNQLNNVRFEQADFLKRLDDYIDEGKQFDAIILDPPKLAGSRNTIDRAMRAYHRLNYSAVRLLSPGGILVTCSCSGRVSRSDFMNVLQGVSKQSHRSIQILEHRSAAPDHPVLVSCPETDYLKCMIVRVL